MTVLPLAVVALCASASLDVAVRADPIVFALGGWSLGFDVAPHQDEQRQRARASIAAFHVEVPSLLVPVVASPSNGLRVVEDAVQIAVRFELGGGWWFGPEVYGYRLSYSRDDFATTTTAHEAYVHASVGWRWFFARDVPIAEFFFVEPWATIGLPVFGTGGANVDGVAVADRGFNWHATVSVGVDLL